MDKITEDFMKLLDRASYGFPHDTIVYDQDGTPLKLGLIDGRFVSPFGQKYFRRVRDIKVRDDDVLLLGYPKTGCHWTWEVLNMIVAGKVGYSKIGKITSMLEAVTPEILESVPGRRILNTHLWYDYIPKQAIEKKTKMVFTVRNPKDTAVSYYNHHLARSEMQSYNGPFNKWFPLFMSGQVDYGSYFDFHVSWDKAIKENPDQQILIVSYEDMKEDLPREIRRMAKFLDINLSDGQVEEIAKAAGFDAMKEAYADPEISKYLIRKGQVGDWKNWLTVAQSEMIDEATEEKLKGTLFSSPRYTI